MTFTQGLCKYNTVGKRGAQTVVVEMQYAPTGTSSWSSTITKSTTGSTNEALRVSQRIVFPSNDTYDIRFRRTTADSSDEKIFDVVYLSAIKAVTYVNPVNCEHICGTAIRIKGTDQLNGTIDQFNAVVSNLIPDYDVDTDTWITRATSNPASIYRYVLQGPANARPLADSKILISDLESWHGWCVERGLTYNRVIDYNASVDDILRDVAAAGFASPAVLDGLRTVVIDRPKDDIVQIFTPRNSSSYSGAGIS